MSPYHRICPRLRCVPAGARRLLQRCSKRICSVCRCVKEDNYISSKGNFITSSKEGSESVSSPQARLFALIIGINKYPHLQGRDLRCAVSDAEAIKQFLQSRLCVPASRIVTFWDEEATLSTIVSALKSIAGVEHPVKKDDPILIYFAGHGAEAPCPQEWFAGGDGSGIQMLLPSDFSLEGGNDEAQGLLDFVFAALLDRIASVKGNNIVRTVILDCCHSGSGTRSTDSQSLVRGFDLPDDYAIGTKRHACILQSLDCGPRRSVPHSLVEGMHSHVLLAACTSDEKAREISQGAFTAALLERLYADGAHNLTYRTLIESLRPIDGQHPQCEGMWSRKLFDSKVPAFAFDMHHVTRSPGGECIMHAGHAQGIRSGTEFDVYSTRDPSSRRLGILRAGMVGPLSTVMSFKKAFQLDPSGGFAFPRDHALKFDLTLRIDKCLSDRHEFHQTQEYLDALARNCEGFRVLAEDDSGEADLGITVDDHQALFQVLDRKCRDYGLAPSLQSVHRQPLDHCVLRSAIAGAARYYWYLRHTPLAPSKELLVDIECTKVERTGIQFETLLPIWEPKGGNLISEDSSITVIAETTPTFYGFRLISKSDQALYIAILYFDNTDFSITSCYHGGSARTRDDADAPLRPHGELTMGYGSGGHPPHRWYLRPGQDVDIGFVKIFVSTSHVDWSSVAQDTPFRHGTPRAPENPMHPPPQDWDAKVISVVIKNS